MSDDSPNLPEYSRSRVPYEHSELRSDDLPADPFEAFELWFERAIEISEERPDLIREPNAMTLSTADAHGRPSSRVVLLKDHGSDGFTFFTNRNSRKGRELAENPNGALLFFWEPLERQVRIEGRVEPTSDAISDAYFSSRSRGSQLSSAASPQSERVENRDALETLREVLAKHSGDAPLVRPPHWGGLRLRPVRFEFWQGRPDRFHDRIVYEAREGAWPRHRIAP